MPKKTVEKKNRVALNTLVATGTREAIDRLRGKASIGDFIDRAVAALESKPKEKPTAREALPVAGIDVRHLMDDETRFTLEEMAEDMTAGGMTVGEMLRAMFVPVTSSPVPSTLLEPDGPEMACEHCGAAFRIPMGAKFTKICPGCVADGHSRDPKDCGECGKGVAA